MHSCLHLLHAFDLLLLFFEFFGLVLKVLDGLLRVEGALAELFFNGFVEADVALELVKLLGHHDVLAD